MEQEDKQVASHCLYTPHKSFPTLSWQVRDTKCWPKALSETCKWINIEHWESIGVLNDISNDGLSLQHMCAQRPECSVVDAAVVCGQSHGTSCFHFELISDISTVTYFTAAFTWTPLHPLCTEHAQCKHKQPCPSFGFTEKQRGPY